MGYSVVTSAVEADMMKTLLKTGIHLPILKDDGGSAEMTVWEWEINLADFNDLFLCYTANDGGGANPRIKVVIDTTTEYNQNLANGSYTKKIDVSSYTGTHTVKILFTEGGNGIITDLCLWGGT